MPLKADWVNADVAADQHPQAHNDLAARLNNLSNVDNTADTAKPVSTAQQAALNLKADQTAVDLKADLTALAAKANLASPALTGTPTAPTAAPGTNTTQLATTAFVRAATASGGTVQVVTSVAPPATPAVNVVWVDLSGIGSY